MFEGRQEVEGNSNEKGTLLLLFLCSPVDTIILLPSHIVSHRMKTSWDGLPDLRNGGEVGKCESGMRSLPTETLCVAGGSVCSGGKEQPGNCQHIPFRP